MKGGVYVIYKDVDNDDPSCSVVKIGRSKNITQRFKSANTYVYNDAHKTTLENIRCILHSPSYAAQGTSILEGLIHHHYRSYRKPQSEFFKFPTPDFDVGKDETLLEFLKSKNIRDVSVYYRLVDVPETQLLPKSLNRPALEVSLPPSPQTTSLQPRPAQLPILKKMHAYFGTHEKGCLFMPPGLGKTYLAGFFLHQTPDWNRALILVPQLLIATEFQTMFRKIGCTKKIITLSSQHDDIKALGDDGTWGDAALAITTYQTYAKHGPRFPSQYDFIVYDEAHHLPEASEYQKALRISGKKLFMTATPKIIKIDEASKNVQHMQEFSLNNPQVYGEVIDSMTIHSAIDNGQLCDYRLIIHQDDDIADLSEPDNIRDCVPALLHLSNIYSRRRMVVFYNTRERAQCAKQRFDQMIQQAQSPIPFRTFYIDGEMGQTEKEKTLDEFTGQEGADPRNAETEMTTDTEASKEGPNRSPCHIIFNVSVLSEGVSLPCVDAVLLMDPKSSPILLTQICGRALRLHPGKTEAVFCIPNNCINTLNVLMQYIFYDMAGTSRRRSLATEMEKRLITHGPSSATEDQMRVFVHRHVKLMEISRTRGKHALFHKWATEGILSGTTPIPAGILETLVQLKEITPEEVHFLQTQLGRRTRLTAMEQYHKARLRNIVLKYYFREEYNQYEPPISLVLAQLTQQLPHCQECSTIVTRFLPPHWKNFFYCSSDCRQQHMEHCAREEQRRQQNQQEEQKRGLENWWAFHPPFKQKRESDPLNFYHQISFSHQLVQGEQQIQLKKQKYQEEEEWKYQQEENYQEERKHIQNGENHSIVVDVQSTGIKKIRVGHEEWSNVPMSIEHKIDSNGDTCISMNVPRTFLTCGMLDEDVVHTTDTSTLTSTSNFESIMKQFNEEEERRKMWSEMLENAPKRAVPSTQHVQPRPILPPHTCFFDP